MFEIKSSTAMIASLNRRKQILSRVEETTWTGGFFNACCGEFVIEGVLPSIAEGTSRVLNTDQADLVFSRENLKSRIFNNKKTRDSILFRKFYQEQELLI